MNSDYITIYEGRSICPWLLLIHSVYDKKSILVLNIASSKLNRFRLTFLQFFTPFKYKIHSPLIII